MTSRDGISPVAAPSCTPNRCKRRDAVASRDERRDAFRARRAVETNDAFSPASDRALPRRDARHRVSAPSTRPPVASRRPSRDAQKFSLVAVKKSTPPRGALSISIPHAVPVPPACDVFDASHAVTNTGFCRPSARSRLHESPPRRSVTIRREPPRRRRDATRVEPMMMNERMMHHRTFRVPVARRKSRTSKESHE